jgi:hypothetical protein
MCVGPVDLVRLVRLSPRFLFVLKALGWTKSVGRYFL